MWWDWSIRMATTAGLMLMFVSQMLATTEVIARKTHLFVAIAAFCVIIVSISLPKSYDIERQRRFATEDAEWQAERVRDRAERQAMYDRAAQQQQESP